MCNIHSKLPTFPFIAPLCMLVLLIALGSDASSNFQTVSTCVDKATVIRMDDSQFTLLMRKWAEQAFASIFTALANRRLIKYPPAKSKSKEFAHCAKKVRNIPAQAKCLARFLRGEFPAESSSSLGSFRTLELSSREAPTSRRLLKYRKQPVKSWPKEDTSFKRLRLRRQIQAQRWKDEQEEVPGQVRQIAGKFEGLGPLGMVGRLLSSVTRFLKNGSAQAVMPWQATVERLRELKHSVGGANSHASFASAQGANEPGGVPSNLFSLLRLGASGSSGDSSSSLSTSERFKDDSDRTEKRDSSKTMNSFLHEGFRLALALANSSRSAGRRPMHMLSPRFLSLFPDDDDGEEEQKNSRGPDFKANEQHISAKLASKPINFLSPSVLSMHDQGSGLERALSLPTLLKHFSTRDREEWMNLVLQAAGVDEQMDTARKLLGHQQPNAADTATHNKGDENRPDAVGDSSLATIARKEYENIVALAKSFGDEVVISGSPMDTSGTRGRTSGESEKEEIALDLARKLSLWDQLSASYTPAQLRELNTTGIAMLTAKQRRLVYGPNSPYKNSATLKRLQRLGTMRRLELALEDDVEAIAHMRTFELPEMEALSRKSNSEERRRGRGKRATTTATPGFSNLILSPLLLSSRVNSPLIAGPVILSPRLFVPLIQSPVVFGPNIISPSLFVPLVLSPYIARPGILSPGLFNPTVLSPQSLSPQIFSPQVFTPQTLSPLLFFPIIFNPIVGSPLILTPRVLSPVIFSYRLLYALVLAPYMLTPSIYSPKPDEIRILSPSWLS